MYHDFTYQATLASSLRGAWELDDVLREDQELDFSRNFLPESLARTAEEYLARLMAAYCQAIGRLDPALGGLVDYEALPEAVWNRVAPAFGLAIDQRTRDRMSQTSRADAKAPVGRSKAFEPDRARKQSSASPALREAVDAIARPALSRLVAALAGVHTGEQEFAVFIQR